VRANRAMVELFGFNTESEMLATASARAEGWYVQPGRRAEFREQLMAQGSLRDFVSEMRRTNGETFWISENAHVVRDAQGNVLYHEGTIEDITARVLAERAAAGASELLRERTDALQLTLDNAGRGIIRVDAGGVVVLYNRRFLELLELPESLLAARPTLAQVIQFQQERGDFGGQLEPIELDPRSGEEIRALDVTVPPAGGSYLRRTRGGLVIEVAIETLPAGGMVRTYSDVTAHYTAQKELAEKTRMLEITLDSMSQGIATIDASGRTVTSNRRHQELLNLPPELMASRPTMEQLVRFQIERGDFGENFQFVDAVARGYVAVGDKVPAIQGPETYLRKTREGKTLEVRTRPLPEGGVVRTFTDMTEYVRTQEALIAAKEAAEAGERAKAEFLANMSHEIRTPMNAVIGMSDLLLDTPLSATQREFAETIRTSGDSLLVLINDILDFSKIESGSLTLEHVPVNLAECVESALDITSGPAVAKGLDLLYWIEDEVPRAIYGDLTRLRQVFINLINNAVKFTQCGEVVVTLSRRPGAPRCGAGRSGLVARIGARHRHRHPGRPHGPPVPGVQPGRCIDDTAVRRHGPGTGDLPPADRTDGRAHLGGVGRGRRFDLPVRDSHADGALRSRCLGEQARCCPGGQAHIAGGRQRHQPPHPHVADLALGHGAARGLVRPPGTGLAGRWRNLRRCHPGRADARHGRLYAGGRAAQAPERRATARAGVDIAG
jgi:PAS domain S-box-containing protein